MPRFNWTPEIERAALLIAQANLNKAQIAEQIGVDERTLRRWLERADFRAKVDETAAEIAAEVRRIGIATITGRVRALNDRWNRMQRVIEARADDPGMAKAPGGSTGLMVHKIKSIGYGENATLVEEYEVDTGLLRELREHEKQAAQELGQWQDKVELTGSMETVVATTDEAAAALAAAAKIRESKRGTDAAE